jgi:type IV pilus assembly protein PilA
MRKSEKGFTLIELMIVVVIIGILAAIAIPNFIAMQDRAKEGSVKANMHTLQLAAEDYGVQNDGVYCLDAEGSGQAGLSVRLPGTFKNPFLGTSGADASFEDRTSFAANPAGTRGLASYADSSSGLTYNVKGVGKVTTGTGFPLTLVLTAGQ